MKDLKREKSRSPTPLPFPECRSPPKTQSQCLHKNKVSTVWFIYTSRFYGFEALPGLFSAEAGGDRRDSTFVWSTHQSHLLQVHMWGCVLPLEHFTIYQLNRQMLNPFLHLLNPCCFRQPANTTHSTLSREAASKHAIP